MKKIDSTSSLRAFIKPQVKVVDMPSQAILAGSTPEVQSRTIFKGTLLSGQYSPNIGE